MPKSKRVPLSSATLLQARNQFLTNGVEPLQPPAADTPVVSPPVATPPPAEPHHEPAEAQPAITESKPEARSHIEPQRPELRPVEPPRAEPITAEQPFAEQNQTAPSADPLHEDEEARQAAEGFAEQGRSKKVLLQHYVESAKNTADTVYLPPELYDVVITVWHQRKRQQRGIKKSHLIIEALLSHPEIVQELRQRNLLK